jgi:glycosyltransferase involved in cell wall biosynthesis
LRIAIICHFTNKEIQQKVKTYKKVKEFAPWIPYFVNEFIKFPEHEFLIISPHEWLAKDTTYIDRNIKYFFYKWGIPLLGRHWPSIIDFDKITQYALNKKKVRKAIRDFNPDVINLFGAENPYYSSTIFQFTNSFPLVITIQGYYRRQVKSRNNKYRLSVENEILSNLKHFIVRSDEMEDYLAQINKNAILHRVPFPIPQKKYQVGDIQKKYDFVFFAKVVREKGIFDYLEAIKAIQKIKDNVTALIIGPCSAKMKEEVSLFIQKNSLSNNIKHLDFFETQDELFKKVKEARISVLPTYNDLISGTIIESMFLGIPVIAYKTGSIPEVNVSGENILICEQGNIQKLTQCMADLIMNTEHQLSLSKNGLNWVQKRYNNESAMQKYFQAMKEAIKEFNDESIQVS